MTIKVTGLCTLLQVFDMVASIKFYRDALGFEIIDTAPAEEPWDWVWLKLGDAHLMLNTAFEGLNRPASPDPARLRAHADTVLFFQCPNVDGAYRSLTAQGLDVVPPTVAPYGMQQLEIADPDGYQLVFQWPAEPYNER